MTNLLITGGLGHIGSFLLKHLSREKYNITVVDDMSTQRYSTLFNVDDVTFWERDFDSLGAAEIERFDAVVHLAARTDAASSVEDKEKTFSVNVTKTCRFIEKIGKNTKFIFPSSTSVYGKGQEIMFEDEDNVDPQSPYAESKNIVERYLFTSDIDYNVLRFGTIFGTSKGMRFHTAINKFCYQASLGRQLTVWRQNYEHHRPYLGLADASQAIEMCLDGKLKKKTVYNVLSENARLSDIVNLIKKNKKVSVNFVDTPLLNQNTYFVNDDKIRTLGFKPNDSLEKGIFDTLCLLSGIKN